MISGFDQVDVSMWLIAFVGKGVPQFFEAHTKCLDILISINPRSV